MDDLLDVDRLVRLHESSVERWHTVAITHDEREPLWKLVLLNHAFNFQLWHEEDKARDPRASDTQIANVKRNIDKWNQQRNDAVERIDEFLVGALAQAGVTAAPDAPLNTETPGSAVDRLSILSLKVFHMREEAGRKDADAAHREKSAGRLAILLQQRADLSASLAALVKDIGAGRKRLKLYRQMKMYNDPTMNPVLYRGVPAKP
jgi:hypothetical protein